MFRLWRGQCRRYLVLKVEYRVGLSLNEWLSTKEPSLLPVLAFIILAQTPAVPVVNSQPAAPVLLRYRLVPGETWAYDLQTKIVATVDGVVFSRNSTENASGMSLLFTVGTRASSGKANGWLQVYSDILRPGSILNQPSYKVKGTAFALLSPTGAFHDFTRYIYFLAGRSTDL